MLNRCSTEVLQYTGITGSYLLNYACKHTRFETLLFLMYEKYTSATISQKAWPGCNPSQIAICKDRHYIISTLLIGTAHLSEKLEGRGETALFDACINHSSSVYYHC